MNIVTKVKLLDGRAIGLRVVEAGPFGFFITGEARWSVGPNVNVLDALASKQQILRPLHTIPSTIPPIPKSRTRTKPFQLGIRMSIHLNQIQQPRRTPRTNLLLLLILIEPIIQIALHIPQINSRQLHTPPLHSAKGIQTIFAHGHIHEEGGVHSSRVDLAGYGSVALVAVGV